MRDQGPEKGLVRMMMLIPMKKTIKKPKPTSISMSISLMKTIRS
jgi:hypothetical protein